MAIREVQLLIPEDRVPQLYRLAADWMTLGEAGQDSAAPTAWGGDDISEARFLLKNCTALGRRILRYLVEQAEVGEGPTIWGYEAEPEEGGGWRISDEPKHGDAIRVHTADGLAKALELKSASAITGSMAALKKVCEQVERTLPFDSVDGVLGDGGSVLLVYAEHPMAPKSQPLYYLMPEVARVLRQAQG